MGNKLWEIQEQLGNFSARWPNGGTPGGAMSLWQTMNPPTGTYPIPDQGASTYYCMKVVGGEFVEQEGYSPLGVQTPGSNPIYDWVYNPTFGFIPLNTIIPVWRRAGQNYTDWNDTIEFSGFTTSANTADIVITGQWEASGEGAYGTGTFTLTNDQQILLPAQWPVTGIGIAGGAFLKSWGPLTCMATLASDLIPGSNVGGQLQCGGSGSIQIYDPCQLGGFASNNVMITYNQCSGTWVLTASGCCATSV
jgi:hypothetical protein